MVDLVEVEVDVVDLVEVEVEVDVVDLVEVEVEVDVLVLVVVVEPPPRTDAALSGLPDLGMMSPSA